MNDENYTIGSGNVFADADLPDAEECFERAELLCYLASEVSRRNLSRHRAASLLGISPLRVFCLLQTRWSGFSLQRLRQMKAKFERNVAVS